MVKFVLPKGIYYKVKDNIIESILCRIMYSNLEKGGELDVVATTIKDKKG